MNYRVTGSNLLKTKHNDRFEDINTFIDFSLKEAITPIDFNIYFDLIKKPLPLDFETVAFYLQKEKIITKQNTDNYAITNLGVISFAKNLQHFSSLYRKALRIALYDGNNRYNLLKAYTRAKGYISDFQECLQLIMALLSSRLQIKSGCSNNENDITEAVVREILINALIHQDFSVTGAGPTIEIFDGRIEVINPGIPLVDVTRIIDMPPKSRNHGLAKLFQKLLCREDARTQRGWDNVIMECEAHNLPAPSIELYGDSFTKITIFSYRDFCDLSTEQKLWSCYMHCCIKYAHKELCTLGSLCDRFRIGNSGRPEILRLIDALIQRKLVKQQDPAATVVNMKYIPYWANT